MGKHSFHQLKLKGTRKPYKRNLNLSVEEKTEHKIKHMQVYKRKIDNEEIKNLPNLIQKLYLYLIKIKIEKIDIFIKKQIIAQINILINAYRHGYTFEEYINTENLIKKKIAELVNTDQVFSTFDIPRNTSKTIIKDILDNYKSL